MEYFLLISTILISACSQTPKSEIQKEVRITNSDLESCRSYRDNVLLAGHVVNQNGDGEFTRDMNLARKVLSQFDNDKALSGKDVQLYKNIISKCTPESLKVFEQEFSRTNQCVLVLHEMQFFQGLASAIKKYPWPTDIQLEGKRVSLDYIRHYAKGEYTLLNRLIALSALDELSLNEIVSKDLHPEIKATLVEAQQYVANLAKRFKGSRDLSCEEMDIVRDELAYSQKVAGKIRELLKRI